MTNITQRDLDSLIYGKQTPTPTFKLSGTSPKPRVSTNAQPSERKAMPTPLRGRVDVDGYRGRDEETLQSIEKECLCNPWDVCPIPSHKIPAYFQEIIGNSKKYRLMMKLLPKEKKR